MESYKTLPYGKAEFEKVIHDNRYLVDKTHFLPLLEAQADNLFLIRPRRFGKSLFLSMMETYYDVNKKDRFQEFFSELWIGQHPTEWQGKFLVLKLDFSKVSGPIDELQQHFNSYLSGAIDSFIDYYRPYFSDSFLKRYDKFPIFDADTKLNALDMEAKIRELRLYLIVDEYDNFTNDVLSQHGEKVYHDLTHAEGFYRAVFKKFKGMFDRIFMMGISPVTLDDLTSGFNIGWHISADAKFNTMLGFTEQDVRTMLQYYREHGFPVGDIEAAIAEMKPWYDNYCFADDALGKDPTIYNCDLALYYINALLSTGKRPKTMLSPNTKTDYKKLRNLIQLDKLDGNRESVLQRIADNGEILDNVELTYPALDLVEPRMFVSQLYYYGMLTITGTYGGRLRLSIPNRNIQEQYYIWMLNHYGAADNSINVLDFLDMMSDMAIEGRWRGAMEYITKSYEENSAVRSAIEGERNIQGYIHAYLSLCKLYLAAPEMEVAHGYADFFLFPDHSASGWQDVHHSYIMELKYVKSDAPAAEADAKWREGVEQADKYASCHRAGVLAQGTALHRIVMLFRGRHIERLEEID